MSMPISLILGVVIVGAVAIPLDTTPTAATTPEIDDELAIKNPSTEINENTSDEGSNAFMNEELELLAINLHDIFRRDTNKVDEKNTFRATKPHYDLMPKDETTNEQAKQLPEMIVAMKKRDVAPASSFKDTHSPDPNFPKYFNK